MTPLTIEFFREGGIELRDAGRGSFRLTRDDIERLAHCLREFDQLQAEHPMSSIQYLYPAEDD